MAVVTEIIQSVYTLSKLIYQQVQLAKANKLQCQRLSERINIVVESVKQLESLKDNEKYLPGLQALEKTLDKSSKFITLFSKDSGWFKQVLKAGSSKDQFDALNDELVKSANLLSLGLNAQQIINREQDKKDQDADLKDIALKQDEIIQLNNESIAAIQKLQIQQAEQKDILMRQFSSLKGQIAKILAGQEKTESVKEAEIDSHLMIPYYELSFDNKLATGSVGIVYLGKWQGNPVAIKTLEVESKGEAIDELKREVKIMSRLRHQNIVQLQGICFEPNHSCIVMEYMDKGSLESTLSNTIFSAEEQKQIALDIAHGLKYLHSRGCLHRDLSSSNILINAATQAKICDFGLSKVKSMSIRSAQKQRHGIAWQAPEHFKRAHTYTTQSDIYSFGMLLWEIVTSNKPYAQFTGINRDKEIVGHVLSGKREEFSPKIPEFYTKLITACWDANPDKRPNLDDIIQQLESYQPNLLQAHIRESSPTREDLYNSAVALHKKGNLDEAIALYKKSANKNYAKAYTSLGIFALERSAGDNANKKLAKEYLEFASSHGHARAKFNLARMYEKGDGVEKDIQKALDLYFEAALLDTKDERIKEKISILSDLIKSKSDGYLVFSK